MNIGKTIQAIRKQKGITQADFAAKVGISKTAVFNIEADCSIPSPKNLATICKVLETPQPILYLMSIEAKDLPEKRRTVFDTLFPTVQKLMFDIIGDDQY